MYSTNNKVTVVARGQSEVVTHLTQLQNLVPLIQCFLTGVRPNPLCSTELSLWGSVKVLQYSNTFRDVPRGPLATWIWKENWTSEGVMTFFFWSSLDFGRKIGRHAVFFWGSVDTATKLLGFGRLARVKKHCFNWFIYSRSLVEPLLLLIQFTQTQGMRIRP